MLVCVLPGRYFLHQWPKLCYLAYDGDTPFGTVVCKMDLHRDHMRGYVAMLVVDKAYRGKGAGKSGHTRLAEEGAPTVVGQTRVLGAWQC